MTDRLTLLVSRGLLEWLRHEAERQDRPVAFVARKCIEAARREAAQERAVA
jgi:hypothetical protein